MRREVCLGDYRDYFVPAAAPGPRRSPSGQHCQECKEKATGEKASFRNPLFAAIGHGLIFPRAAKPDTFTLKALRTGATPRWWNYGCPNQRAAAYR